MTVFPNLDKGLSLRPFDDEMIGDLVRELNNPNVLVGLNPLFPNPYTEESARDWIKLCTDPSTMLSAEHAPLGKTLGADDTDTIAQIPSSVAVCLEGRVIGSIGVTTSAMYSRTLNLGYWYGESYWGKGYATIVARAYVNWLFDTLPWLIRVESCRYAWNPASGAVLLKAGLELEGIERAKICKDGRIGDIFTYAKIRPGLEYESAVPKQTNATTK